MLMSIKDFPYGIFFREVGVADFVLHHYPGVLSADAGCLMPGSFTKVLKEAENEIDDVSDECIVEKLHESNKHIPL